MSETMSPELAPPRAVLDQDWRRIGRYGGLIALSLVFVALSNMPVSMETFDLIADQVTLGDVSLWWLLLVAGFAVGKEVVLEGMTAHARGLRDVVAGACTGAIAAAGLSVLAVLIDNYDLRDPLINWSPQTLEKLSLGGSVGSGVVLWLAAGAVIGALGGSLHVLSERVRRLVVTMLVAVFLIAILKTVLSDIAEDITLEWLTDIVYAKRGGLTIVGVVIVAVLSGLLVVGSKPGKDARRFQALEGADRAKGNAVAFGVVAVATVVLPMVLGGITNELLANVGLFVLLALGLNIVVGLAGILDLGYIAFFAVGGTPPNPHIAEPWRVVAGMDA